MFQMPIFVQEIIERLEGAGYKAYAVGGCIRDPLIGLEPNDWDIATSAQPNDIKKVFTRFKTIDTGIKHGTVTLIYKGSQVEVTTFRKDGAYLDGRHPSYVEFSSSIIDDLARRDFTMNAVAFNETEGFIDPFGGIDDIRSMTIRAVGDAAERFGEDALRIMRAMRFASTLSFKIESELNRQIHECKNMIKQVSPERVSNELLRLLAGNGVFPILMEYPDALGVFIPEILPAVKFDQNNPHHLFDVWEHTAKAVSLAKRDPLVRLCLLFHDLAKPAAFKLGDDGYGHFHGHPRLSSEMAENRLKMLRFDNKTIETVKTVVYHHDEDLSGRKIERWLNLLGQENFRILLEVRKADALAQAEPYSSQRVLESESLLPEIDRVIAEKKCLDISGLKINGDILKKLGLSEGPQIGEALKIILNKVLDGELPNDDSELAFWAKKWIQEKNLH